MQILSMLSKDSLSYISSPSLPHHSLCLHGILLCICIMLYLTSPLFLIFTIYIFLNYKQYFQYYIKISEITCFWISVILVGELLAYKNILSKHFYIPTNFPLECFVRGSLTTGFWRLLNTGQGLSFSITSLLLDKAYIILNNQLLLLN